MSYQEHHDYIKYWNEMFNPKNGYPECIGCKCPVLHPSLGGWNFCSSCDVGRPRNRSEHELAMAWAGRKKSSVQDLMNLKT